MKIDAPPPKKKKITPLRGGSGIEGMERRHGILRIQQAEFKKNKEAEGQTANKMAFSCVGVQVKRLWQPLAITSSDTRECEGKVTQGCGGFFTSAMYYGEVRKSRTFRTVVCERRRCRGARQF